MSVAVLSLLDMGAGLEPAIAASLGRQANVLETCGNVNREYRDLAVHSDWRAGVHYIGIPDKRFVELIVCEFEHPSEGQLIELEAMHRAWVLGGMQPFDFVPPGEAAEVYVIFHEQPKIQHATGTAGASARVVLELVHIRD